MMGINKICVPAFSGTKKKFNIFLPESLDRAAEHASQLSGLETGEAGCYRRVIMTLNLDMRFDNREVR